MVQIRLPSETTYGAQYPPRRRQSFLLSPRLWRRAVPVLILFVLAVECWRFFAFTPSVPLHSSPKAIAYAPDDAIHQFDPGPLLPTLKNLIIVACHGIWLGGSSHGDRESEWVLEDFQVEKDYQSSFIAHVEAGVAAAQKDPEALLLFSGGETRRRAGPRTEGGSYFELAVARGLIVTDDTVWNRTSTEVASLDSYQNLLFSLCRFREVVGDYPETVTVVSYAFKEKRFKELHRRAVAWPEGSFKFIGLDPKWSSEQEREEVMNGEKSNAVELWKEDPYGCAESGLREKRRRRNWGRRAWGYEDTCPEMKALMRWCQSIGVDGVQTGKAWFDQSLPWSESL